MLRFKRLGFLSWRGFGLQLLLIAILPLSILLVVVALVSQMLHHEAMRSMVGDRDLRAVRVTANSLNLELNHLTGTLRMLASELGDRQDLASLPVDFSLVQQSFDGGLALFAPDGRLLGTTPGSLGWTSSPALAEALQDLQDRAANGPAFSQRLVPGSGKALTALAGILTGNNLLVGAFTPERLVGASLLGVIDPTQASVLVLAAPGPQVLYSLGIQDSPEQLSSHPGIADALEGQSGINYFQTNRGEHLVAFSPIPLAGWTLVIEEAWEETAGPYLNTTQAAPLVLVPVLLLAILALWFGARRVIQPLQALEKQAKDLADGNFSAIQQPVGGIAEIRQLQVELIDLAQKVKIAQESLHGYIGAITSSVEMERRSLARELHDDTIQSLIAINQRIQLVLPEAHTEEEQRALGELRDLAQQAMSNLRRMIRGLCPIYLEELGLAAALRMLAQEVSQVAQLKVHFEVVGAERSLEPKVALAFLSHRPGSPE